MSYFKELKKRLWETITSEVAQKLYGGENLEKMLETENLVRKRASELIRGKVLDELLELFDVEEIEKRIEEADTTFESLRAVLEPLIHLYTNYACLLLLSFRPEMSDKEVMRFGKRVFEELIDVARKTVYEVVV